MDWLYLILFSLLLIPNDYYHLPTLPEANLAIVLNPGLMLLLTISVMTAGLLHFFKGRPYQEHLKESG